jgi:hypothetical protein
LIIATAVREPVRSAPSSSAYHTFRSSCRCTPVAAGITNRVHCPQSLSCASPSGTCPGFIPLTCAP